MPATKVGIVPYLVAIVYLSTFVWYSDFTFSSHSQLWRRHNSEFAETNNGMYVKGI